MISAARAGALAFLVAACIGGVSCIVVGLKAYAHGRATMEAEKDREIASMLDRAQRDKAEADARADALTESMRLAKQGADYAREKERAANAAALRRVAADRDRLRDALDAAASGGVQTADDSVSACRDRAETLGRVLGDALQAHAECSAEAEDLATSVRTLRRAWPRLELERPLDDAGAGEVGSAHSLKGEP